MATSSLLSSLSTFASLSSLSSLAPGALVPSGSLRIWARLRKSQLGHARAELARALRGQPRGRARVLFVLGCQRSGTTLMTEFFEADAEAKVYPEHSSLSARDRAHRLRLAPLGRVAATLERSRFPRIVLKPLVESQRTHELLEAVEGSRALWMFRDWRDVARSNLARFGRTNGIRNLRSIADRSKEDWRCEGLTDACVRVVAEAFDEGMRPYDAAALFWWVRNQLFFDQELGRDARVRLCRYEDLVADPAGEMARVYAFMGDVLPGDLGFARVSQGSLGLGREIDVSDAVAARCDEMQRRLQAAYEGQA